MKQSAIMSSWAPMPLVVCGRAHFPTGEKWRAYRAHRNRKVTACGLTHSTPSESPAVLPNTSASQPRWPITMMPTTGPNTNRTRVYFNYIESPLPNEKKKKTCVVVSRDSIA